MKRIPRKKKKQIPKDIPYCYTPIKFDMETGIYHTKTCPFYEHKEDGLIGHCRLVNCEVWDQVKVCGEKEGY